MLPNHKWGIIFVLTSSTFSIDAFNHFFPQNRHDWDNNMLLSFSMILSWSRIYTVILSFLLRSCLFLRTSFLAIKVYRFSLSICFFGMSVFVCVSICFFLLSLFSNPLLNQHTYCPASGNTIMLCQRDLSWTYNYFTLVP